MIQLLSGVMIAHPEGRAPSGTVSDATAKAVMARRDKIRFEDMISPNRSGLRNRQYHLGGGQKNKLKVSVRDFLG